MNVPSQGETDSRIGDALLNQREQALKRLRGHSHAGVAKRGQFKPRLVKQSFGVKALGFQRLCDQRSHGSQS